jgi:hypothetical protein
MKGGGLDAAAPPPSMTAQSTLPSPPEEAP